MVGLLFVEAFSITRRRESEMFSFSEMGRSDSNTTRVTVNSVELIDGLVGQCQPVSWTRNSWCLVALFMFGIKWGISPTLKKSNTNLEKKQRKYMNEKTTVILFWSYNFIRMMNRLLFKYLKFECIYYLLVIDFINL